MKIELKFDVYDVAFFMRDNKILTDEINKIEINRYIENYSSRQVKNEIIYTTMNNGDFYSDVIFKTKQDLLNSL